MVTPPAVPDPVRRWARRPGVDAMLVKVRKKVEAGHTGDKVQIAVAANDREAVGRMLGIEWELSGKPVLLGRLRDSLAKDGADLIAVLTDVGGPLRDRPAERQMKAQTRERLRSLAVAHLSAMGVPYDVVDLALARRWLGPIESATEVASTLAKVWSALPTRADEAVAAPVVVGLAEFAGRELRDPHALDRSQPLGRAAVRLLAGGYAHLDHQSEPSNARIDAVVAAVGRSLRAAEWRATWAVPASCATRSLRPCWS